MAKRTKRLTEQDNEKDEIRINKFLSEAGVCSRREADRYILEGKVKIDGIVAQMGSKVTKENQVTFCDKPLKKEEKLVLIAFNKPEGIVCTTDQNDPDNIIDYINYGMRIYPIGRLDKDSEGLILLTNDGNIVNKILRAENNHEKEYIVTVNKEITQEFIKEMSSGVPILDTVTKPCVVNQIDKNIFSIVLTQGLNRQIRRMCEHLGYRVINLRRIRIMNIQLGRLKTGDFRNVTEKEIEELNNSFQQQKSHNELRHREVSLFSDGKDRKAATSVSNRVKDDGKAEYKEKRSKENNHTAKSRIVKSSNEKNFTEENHTDTNRKEKNRTEKKRFEKNSSAKSSTIRNGVGKNSTEKSYTGKSYTEKSSAGKSSAEKSSIGKSSAGKNGTEKSYTVKGSAEKNSTMRSKSDKNKFDKNKSDKNNSIKSHSDKRDRAMGINSYTTKKRYHK